jgi:hypothetical protein
MRRIVILCSIAALVACKSESKKPVNPTANKAAAQVDEPDESEDGGKIGDSSNGGNGSEPPATTTTPPPSGRTAAQFVQAGDPALWAKLNDSQKASLAGISEEAFKAMTPEQVSALLQIQPGAAGGGAGGLTGAGNLTQITQLLQQLIQQGGGLADAAGGGEDDFDGGDDTVDGGDFGDFGDEEFELRARPGEAQ